jgi:NAD+ synthase
MASLNYKSVATQITRFIQSSFKSAKCTDAVIGLSGGVDSAVSCAFAVRALGKAHVFPLLLPYGTLSRQSVVDARMVISWLSIPEKNVRTADITSMANTAIENLDPTMDEGRRGNIMARMRMIVLYDAAKTHRALVLGTENKTEHLLGYYTKFGDEASDIEPLRHLYKTQVYQLARFLGIPEGIATKAPTAGLWEGQTDEGELGFTYKEVDTILALHVDQHKSRKEIEAMGYTKKLLDRMWHWITKGTYKQRAPYVAAS